jgi:hypothetical protein
VCRTQLVSRPACVDVARYRASGWRYNYDRLLEGILVLLDCPRRGCSHPSLQVPILQPIYPISPSSNAVPQLVVVQPLIFNQAKRRTDRDTPVRSWKGNVSSWALEVVTTIYIIDLRSQQWWRRARTEYRYQLGQDAAALSWPHPEVAVLLRWWAEFLLSSSGVGCSGISVVLCVA